MNPLACLPFLASLTSLFFTDIWFLSNHPCTRPSSWLPEKTPGCQERYWYSLRAPRNRPDAHLFLLAQMHHKILEQFTLFKQPSSWETCAGWFTSCKQKWYMDLPSSACAPRFTYISTVFGCHTTSSDFQSRTVWTHSTWTYHWGLERSWHFDTTWSSRTIPAELWGHITHISVYLWGILLDGGMTEIEIKSLCCLSTFAWTFPATSAEHFLAFAFLATTF